jgi:hypothetical protein
MMAKFMVSLFWAPQANTLPMTFWYVTMQWGALL